MIDIIIDNREINLFKIIIDRDLDIYKDKINIQKKQLDIGDIHILFDNFLYIYERKTLNDLLSSINDGRYREQKTRLKNSNANSINYIIEGDNIISNKFKNNQKKLTSVYFNSIYRDKINIFFTNDINDTVTFLLLLTTKIIDKPSNFINNSNEDNFNYIDSCKIKTEKKLNITKDICYLLQLSQIPSISKELAKKIKDKFPSLIILITTLKNSDDAIKLLMDIDGIGKTKANTIYQYLI